MVAIQKQWYRILHFMILFEVKLNSNFDIVLIHKKVRLYVLVISKFEYDHKKQRA